LHGGFKSCLLIIGSGSGTIQNFTCKGVVMKKIQRISMLFMLLVLSLALPLTSVAARQAYPEVIHLPPGFQPEGIARGIGHTFYTGSLNGGAIFRGDLRSGEVEMIAEPGTRMATGMKFDPRSGLLFVAGGVFGTANIFDGETGELVASYQLTTSASFINDVIITRQAAYFTDSFQKQFYRMPLGAGGALPDPGDVQTIPLGDGFDFTPGDFNANGIAATPNGKQLIIINSSFGKLYRVNPMTGEANSINLTGGDAQAGDGLVLRGHTMYVVQNSLNRIAVIELSSDYASGDVTGYLSSPAFRFPTTAAAFGDALYAVNARFDEIPPGQPAPDDTFEAVRVEIH
jgi:sugar lactone lactonase YvrE